MTRKPLVTGIAGHDGSSHAELLPFECDVHGSIRRASTFNASRIDCRCADPHDPGAWLLLYCRDLQGGARLVMLLAQISSGEIYDLAQAHLQVSFDIAEHAAVTTGRGINRVPEAVRLSGIDARSCRASSDRYGASLPGLNTPPCPRSPCAATRLHGNWITRDHREVHGLFAVNGILPDHESPRCADNSVARNIIKAVGCDPRLSSRTMLTGEPACDSSLGVPRGDATHVAG